MTATDDEDATEDLDADVGSDGEDAAAEEADVDVCAGLGPFDTCSSNRAMVAGAPAAGVCPTIMPAAAALKTGLGRGRI